MTNIPSDDINLSIPNHRLKYYDTVNATDFTYKENKTKNKDFLDTNSKRRIKTDICNKIYDLIVDTVTEDINEYDARKIKLFVYIENKKQD